MEIIEAVTKNSSIYKTPDNRIGYGIPDFQKAFDSLHQQRTLRNARMVLGNNKIKIYPNPFKDNLTVLINPDHTANGVFGLFDAGGKLYFTKQIALKEGSLQIINFNDLQQLQRGMYLLNFNDGFSRQSFKIILQ
jgi:hypothetical protein